MRDKLSLEFENDEAKSYCDSDVAVLKIKLNAFNSITDLDISRRLLQWFDIVSGEENIKAVLVLNEKGCLGRAAYEVFVAGVSAKKAGSETDSVVMPKQSSYTRLREVNVLNSFIMAVINYRKIVVSGLNGTVVTPFFGASLASNFRFATENSTFCFIHTKYGLHAGGALPFFLPKYIGMGKASEYVLNGGEINAEDAYEMGLVNKIFPEDNFDKRCIEETKKLCSFDNRYLRWSKELLISYRNDLIDYLHKEEKFIENY